MTVWSTYLPKLEQKKFDVNYLFSVEVFFYFIVETNKYFILHQINFEVLYALVWQI